MLKKIIIIRVIRATSHKGKQGRSQGGRGGAAAPPGPPKKKPNLISVSF